MSEAPALVLALLAGALLGIIFFGGLLWTVRRGLLSRRPAAWFMGSILVRAAIVLAGFCLVAHGDWRRLLACLLGFILSRVLVTLLSRPAAESGKPTVQGGGP